MKSAVSPHKLLVFFSKSVPIPAQALVISFYFIFHAGARGESKVLFVKNLSYDTEESTLTSMFEGSVSARIPTFPDSGKPRG